MRALTQGFLFFSYLFVSMTLGTWLWSANLGLGAAVAGFVGAAGLLVAMLVALLFFVLNGRTPSPGAVVVGAIAWCRHGTPWVWRPRDRRPSVPLARAAGLTGGRRSPVAGEGCQRHAPDIS